MKVALVHDYLREYGGAEAVLEDLHQIFPDAPVFTTYLNPKGLGFHWEKMKNWQIKTSWMQHFPFINKLLSPFRIFAPFTFRSFNLKEFDIVISSSNIYFANCVVIEPQTLHIAYIHTPPKMLYGYTTSFNYKKHWLTRIGGELANHFLRILDFESKQNPDILVANSQNVKKRIAKFYRRDAVVIYPGVDIEKYNQVKKAGGEYFLALNRLVRGKGTEIIISACTRLNLPLKVVGSGPELENLKKIAGKSIEFLGHVNEEEKINLYSSARALVVCTEEEDFGITPIESMAAGTPVIACRCGGYLETVIEGKTGEFFDVPKNLGQKNVYVDETAASNLAKLLESFKPKIYKEEDCRSQAKKFSSARFKKEILTLIEQNFPKKDA